MFKVINLYIEKFNFPKCNYFQIFLVKMINRTINDLLPLSQLVFIIGDFHIYSKNKDFFND
jgi:hypothetical protein